MEKTLITKVLFWLGLQCIKGLVKRKDNKIGLEALEAVEGAFYK